MKWKIHYGSITVPAAEYFIKDFVKISLDRDVALHLQSKRDILITA